MSSKLQSGEEPVLVMNSISIFPATPIRLSALRRINSPLLMAASQRRHCGKITARMCEDDCWDAFCLFSKAQEFSLTVTRESLRTEGRAIRLKVSEADFEKAMQLIGFLLG